MTTPIASQTPVSLPVAKSRRKWPWVVGGVVALFLIIGIANSGTTPTSTGAAAPTMAQPSAPAQLPAAPSGPATTISSGTYVVGTDVVPGSYKTSGSTSSFPCYWARLKDTSGDFSAIIANGNPEGPTTVTISKADGAFQTTGCSTWQKVG